MPLNRPALSLGSGPRGVQDARRWVVAVCNDIDRGDLSECAALGVSELLTNALLHAESPVTVRVRGTVDHPRIEVRDGSREPPMLPNTEPVEDDDDFLLTFGRGLSIVARCSTAWGAEIEEDGKVVWFVPAADFAEDDGVEGVVTGVAPSPPPARDDADLMHIDILGVPLRLYAGFQMHYRELRREVRLLALAAEANYPLAKSLSDLFGSLERELRSGIDADYIDEATRAGETEVDLNVVIARETAVTIDRFLELLDLADAFCRQQRLLSLARTPEQRDFQRWFLGEFVRQRAGERPLTWNDVQLPGRQSVS